MTAIAQFTVHGLAKPQGSKKAIMGPNQRFPSVVESAGDKLKHWRHIVAQAAADAMGDTPPTREPVLLTVTFHLPRPKGDFGTGRNAGTLKKSAPKHPTKKPDLDKLVRAVCDSLSNRVYKDDSQVVGMMLTKQYTETSPRADVAVFVA